MHAGACHAYENSVPKSRDYRSFEHMVHAHSSARTHDDRQRFCRSQASLDARIRPTQARSKIRDPCQQKLLLGRRLIYINISHGCYPLFILSLGYTWYDTPTPASVSLQGFKSASSFVQLPPTRRFLPSGSSPPVVDTVVASSHTYPLCDSKWSTLQGCLSPTSPAHLPGPWAQGHHRP